MKYHLCSGLNLVCICNLLISSPLTSFPVYSAVNHHLMLPSGSLPIVMVSGSFQTWGLVLQQSFFFFKQSKDVFWHSQSYLGLFMCSSLRPLCYKTKNSSGMFSPADRTFEANVSPDCSVWTDVPPWEESWVFHFSSFSEQWRSLISGEFLVQQDFYGKRPHFRASSLVSDLWGQFFGCLHLVWILIMSAVRLHIDKCVSFQVMSK